MKKLLILGGSRSQIPQIKKAVDMGLYVITCDYLPDNPGHKFSHEYYNVSTIDKEAVFELSRKLKIDGIVCGDFEPNTLTVVYVCEKMGLPTHPYKSVEILTNKGKYRQFLRENNFNTPQSKFYYEIKDAMKDIDSFKLPVFIKPVDSSGSRGVTIIQNIDDLKKQAEHALSFSRTGGFVIEERVKTNGYQIDADGFSVNGKLVFRDFSNQHLDSSLINPFVPTGISFPCDKPIQIQDKIHGEIQRLLTLLKMQTGPYNFEIMVDDDENVYLMEISPRHGGSFIPEVIAYATGVDMVRYNIKDSIGIDCSGLIMKENNGFWSTCNVHSRRKGILKNIWLDKELKENNIIDFEMFYEPGEKIDAFTGLDKTLGKIIMKYDTMEEMLKKMDNIEKWVRVIIEE
ncbi:MAG: ATP-grasp domain-containing protein [Bacteroidales bacterium]|jgi:biotin carboxylase|nr:ATP-grasp domain-containing protein [Bacteroidales bacterium]